MNKVKSILFVETQRDFQPPVTILLFSSPAIIQPVAVSIQFCTMNCTAKYWVGTKPRVKRGINGTRTGEKKKVVPWKHLNLTPEMRTPPGSGLCFCFWTHKKKTLDSLLQWIGHLSHLLLLEQREGVTFTQSFSILPQFLIIWTVNILGIAAAWLPLNPLSLSLWSAATVNTHSRHV